MNLDVFVIGILVVEYLILYVFSGILVKFADTPLVRASGRELCYVILGGILLCYLNTFILLAKPGIVVCTLQRFTVSKEMPHIPVL